MHIATHAASLLLKPVDKPETFRHPVAAVKNIAVNNQVVIAPGPVATIVDDPAFEENVKKRLVLAVDVADGEDARHIVYLTGPLCRWGHGNGINSA